MSDWPTKATAVDWIGGLLLKHTLYWGGSWVAAALLGLAFNWWIVGAGAALLTLIHMLDKRR